MPADTPAGIFKGSQGDWALICILGRLEDERGVKKQLGCCKLQSGLLWLSSGMQTQGEIH